MEKASQRADRPHPGPHCLGPIYGCWRSLLVRLSDPYRPELHYMRGPGPKWRARHPEPGENGSPCGQADVGTLS